MLSTRRVTPLRFVDHYPTFLSRPNQLFVAWRLLGLSLHFTAFLTLIDYRLNLIANSLPPLGSFEQVDYEIMRQSTYLALSLTFIAMCVPAFGVLSARTVKMTGLNLWHGVNHTIAGVLLLRVWLETWHSVRVWHIAFIFGFPPAALECIVLLWTRMRGDYIW
jgi:hypothetical protein